jgi:hypothetical protein
VGEQAFVVALGDSIIGERQKRCRQPDERVFLSQEAAAVIAFEKVLLLK